MSICLIAVIVSSTSLAGLHLAGALLLSTISCDSFRVICCLTLVYLNFKLFCETSEGQFENRTSVEAYVGTTQWNSKPFLDVTCDYSVQFLQCRDWDFIRCIGPQQPW